MNKLDKLDIPKISSALLYFSKSKIIKENLFYIFHVFNFSF